MHDHKYLDLLFFIGFAFLACHELDAVMQSEWRLLPILSQLDDSIAYPWFVLLHVPLFALLLWWTGSTAPGVRFRAQITLDAFMVVHLGLHLALRSHPDNTFHSALSETCIWGAGLVGAAHGVLSLRANRLRAARVGPHSGRR
jgi:hypothetical protein